MTDNPQVLLHVHVSIDYKDDAYETGLTVSEWNALTPTERSKIRSEAWDAAAQADDGGIWTDTPGATDE